MTTPLDAALALAAAGISVVPARADGTKAPAAASWRQYMQRPADEPTIRRWFTSGHPGIGIVTGAVSGNLEMLEFEGRAVDEGLVEAYSTIVVDSGLGPIWQAITGGYTERTPSGGIHYLYRVTGGDIGGNTKLASRPSTPAELEAAPKARVQVLMETRGEGGYVVVAPSHGPVHPTGRPWELLAGGPATIATITADQRDALHTIARMLTQQPEPEPAPEPTRFTRPGAAAAADRDGLTPGDDYEARTDWADILGPVGWTLVTQRGHTAYWRRPGKTAGVSATTGRDPARDRLWVFTSSTEFTAETPYTKFGAHTLLNHAGDYSAAARALRHAGYGTPHTNPPRRLTAVPTQTPAAGPFTQPSTPPTDGTAALADPPPVDDPISIPARPIDIDITHEPHAILAIGDAIRAGAIPDGYVRNGSLVQITRVSGDATNAHRPQHTVQHLTSDSLRRLLARHTDVYRMKKTKEGPEPVPASPTVAVCKAVLSETDWPDLPPLAALVGMPVLRPDGALLQTPGYDPATAYYYAPQTELTPIPDHPTPTQTADARAFVLDHVLGDFPWAGPADRANYLALLVSPILRPYIGGLTPLGAISAADRGSGKTLLADVIGRLYGSTVRPWVSDDDELRKSITAVLMQTTQVVTFDNVGDHDSVKAPALAKLLTSSIWDDRVLGRSEQARLTNDRLWLVTGNNVRFGGDIAQRTVLVHLDPRCPRPDLRTGFRIPDLDEWLEADNNRGDLLHALLVLVRSWIAAGAPRGDYAMRSFRRWARALGGFLAHHDVPGFLTNADQLESQDDEASSWVTFLTSWEHRFGPAPQTAATLLKSTQTHSNADPWAGTFITRADGTPPTTKGLGMMLAARRGRYFGDLVLRGVQDAHTKVWYYTVERDQAAGEQA